MRGLGAAYWTALPAQPLPDVHWVARSDALAARTRRLPTGCAASRRFRRFAGNAPAQPAAAAGQRLQRPPVRRLGRPAGRRPRAAAGRGRLAARPAGDAAQGQRPHAVFAHGRRPRGAALVDPRVPVLRGDAPPRHPDHARTGVIGSPQPVLRETIETAAVVTRVAPSFLRFGHFEHFAHTAADAGGAAQAGRLRDRPLLPRMPRRAAAAVRAGSARSRAAPRALMAQWQAVGFCHGVMNTDNMSILGLTIDYGPFGFLDGFDPAPHLQPQRPPGALRLCAPARHRVLEPACAGAGGAAADRRADEQASEALADAIEPYKPEFGAAIQRALRAKLGLATEQDDDCALIDDLLRLMAKERTDYTHRVAPPRRALDRGGRRRLAGARPVHRPRGLRRLGRALCAAPARREQHRCRTPRSA